MRVVRGKMGEWRHVILKEEVLACILSLTGGGSSSVNIFTILVEAGHPRM